MQKFSNITGQNIPQEPIVEISKEEKEYKEMKMGILALMDNFLTIRSNGTPRQELVENNIKIDGKEMFAEALIDLIKGESKKENIKVLESLKSETKDWLVLENKIDQLHREIEFIKKEETKLRKKNIKLFLETYSDDESFDMMLEKYLSRILNSKEAFEKANVAKSMIGKSNNSKLNQRLGIMTEGLYRRSNQLKAL